ncbi:ABC transporter substrate-binding protein [Thermodesulfobacteriota bacterium]
MNETTRLTRRTNLFIAFCLISSIAFFGFVKRTEAKTPQRGGILHRTVSEPRSLGYPATMTGQTDGQTSSVALETLFRFDKQSNIVPLLATGWKTDPDAKTITITLRRGVKFHDGSDFNASVCKWNLDKYRKEKRRRPELKKVSSVDIIDDYTVRLNLSVFDNTIVTFLANCADAGRMISRKAFEAHDREWCEQNPVGTGPFQFVSRKKDVIIKWKRFDGYWGSRPYLDGIEMHRIMDPTVALMAFKSGELHIARSVNPKNAKDLEKEGKYIMYRTQNGQVPALGGYAKDPKSPFSKLKVRQALAYAIDVPAINRAFGLGYWTVQNQWAVPGTWGYNPDVAGYPYNPEKAKKLLAEAGYPNGFKTTLNFYNLRPIYVDEATAMQRYLKDVGIDIKLNGVQRPKFAEMASMGTGWEGLIRMQGFSNPDPLVKYAGVAAGNEFAGVYLPPDFTALFNKATTAKTFENKKKMVLQLMKMATDQYCIAAHLYVKTSPSFKTPKLHDDLIGEVPFGYMSPFAWIEK